MIESSWLTKHERRVLMVALDHERATKTTLAKRAAKAQTRAMATADVYVCADLIRQLSER